MKPASLHLLRPEMFPITIRIISGKDGSELWSRTIERPPSGVLDAIEIPGYGHTDHAPVRVAITFADGSEEEG